VLGIGRSAETQPSCVACTVAVVSVQDQRRILEALYALSEHDLDSGATFEQINAALKRDENDPRLPRALGSLLEAEMIELGTDAARITPKGVWMLGKGERPPQDFIGNQ
jgi:hypothetical protein